MPKKNKQISLPRRQAGVWQAMNQPVVEVTDEAARSIFLVAAVLLLMVWMMPNFGSNGIAAASSSLINQPINGQATETAYQPLFTPYQEVAGAITSPQEQVSPAWYSSLSVTGESLGDFYHETVVQPFASATVELFDISAPVTAMADFFKPGTDAAWNAWLELMQDPGT